MESVENVPLSEASPQPEENSSELPHLTEEKAVSEMESDGGDEKNGHADEDMDVTGQAGDSPAPKASPKSSSNRNRRRTQEVKDRSTFLCPLCNKNCLTQHQLTKHIRQHNTDSGETSHSCSICGKALSSASSLDRHMLVHSGERPYKCSVCDQTFTTNGNMHRHMKIHVKVPSSVPPTNAANPKRLRPAVKRKASVVDDGEKIGEPASKKALLVSPLVEQGPANQEEELLSCPICFKAICKSGLQSHMKTHPKAALRCSLCQLNVHSHQALLLHKADIHKQIPTDPSGKPFIQNNPSIPVGFGDMCFMDFSCHNFPRIAQLWCETNLRRCASKYNRFVCEVCDRAFPLQESLDLHLDSYKDKTCAKSVNDTIEDESKDSCESEISKEANEPISHDTTAPTEKVDFMLPLGLQPTSLIKPEQSEDERQQEVLDSIRFVHVECPATNLPQETGSSCGFSLLDPIAVQGLSKSTLLGLISLQPLQGGLAGGFVRPVGSQTGVEMADMHQMAASVPSQVNLPLLPKAPGSPLQADPKQLTPVKLNPSVTPRSSMGTQHASSGCISPGLPPPLGQLLVASKQSSNSSPVAFSLSNWENDTAATILTANINMGKGDSKERDRRKSEGVKPLKTEYPCRICKRVFLCATGLQAHMRNHLGASPYQCSICTYSAPDNATLIRHLRTHSGERPYACRLCHYPFTVKANCERHLRKKHMKTTREEIEKNVEYITTSTSVTTCITGSTPDVLDSAITGSMLCGYCGEDLKSYRALQIHLRTHSGCPRKPFKCRQCGAAFLAKRNCIHHLLKQHPDVPEREVEDHINAVVPVTVASSVPNSSPALSSQVLSHAVQPQPGTQRVNDFCGTSDQGQPLDLSSKTLVSEAVLSFSDSSMEPIDFSIPKGLERKKAKRKLIDATCLHIQETKNELSLSPENSMGKDSSVHLTLPFSSCATTPTSDYAKECISPVLPVNVVSPVPNSSSVLSSDVVPQTIQPQSGQQDVSNHSGAADRNQPVDLSGKTIKNVVSVMKSEDVLQSGDSSMEPIDFSVPLGPERKKAKRELVDTTSLHVHESKKELSLLNHDKSTANVSGVQVYLPLSVSSLASTIRSDSTNPANRLKLLLPKPASNTSEMAPLASIAQIISSVTTAPVMLKAEISAKNGIGVLGGVTLNDTVCPSGSVPSLDASKKRCKNRVFMEEKCETAATTLSKIDQESIGELPSVEKMLATTDANKFSPYLQSRQLEPEEEKQSTNDGQKAKKDKKPVPPKSKRKKNAYSNSVQKMKCPYCPRVFPWSSSLQRHVLTHTGQKPFPCSQCDAFFSTKSNCERHLLRKHGVSSRSVSQDADTVPEYKTEDGSLGNADAFFDAEPQAKENDSPNSTVLTEELENNTEENKKGLKDLSNMDSDKNDDDTESIDMNFGSKILEFKLSGAEQEPAETSEPELEPEISASQELPHTCSICGKTFQHAATLVWHQKFHLQQNKVDDEGKETSEQPLESMPSIGFDAPPKSELEQETGATEKEESGSTAESGVEEEEKENQKEERSEEEEEEEEEGEGEEEEGSSSELRCLEKEKKRLKGGKSDRRKICKVCSKRFWSLQDLTRHLRSHTGERPYKCLTCERTFTLKHSLVRHQRIHKKSPDSSRAKEADDFEGTDVKELHSSSGKEEEAQDKVSDVTAEEEEEEEEEEYSTDKTSPKPSNE